MSSKTSKIGIEITADAQRLIKERSSIWERYDEAVEQEKQLDRFAGEFGSSSKFAEMACLSTTQTPPDEVAAVVWKLKQESQEIKRMNDQIDSYHKDIEETKKQFFVVVACAVVVVFIPLMMLIT
ncbi:MAG: hypothetical protein AAFY72_16055 [Cyanobacteria bacterium J06649_4]